MWVGMDRTGVNVAPRWDAPNPEYEVLANAKSKYTGPTNNKMMGIYLESRTIIMAVAAPRIVPYRAPRAQPELFGDMVRRRAESRSIEELLATRSFT
mgnify:CR=1 FL=1